MSEAVLVAVRLTPRAGWDVIEGPGEDGVIHARVAAAPVGGAANRALVRLIADALGVPPTSISLVSGATGRHKRVRISGVDAAAVRARWPGVRLG